MIEPLPQQANCGPHAKIVCDVCGTSAEFANDYERSPGGRWRPNEGQIIRKAQDRGWLIKGKSHLCASCADAKRKEQKERAKTVNDNVMPLREPTREQKREIMEMLKVAYDVSAGRYVGGNTDQTIAAELGGGIMPGWVAEIRDEWFGPDGGNDEIEAVIADLTKWQADMDASAKAMHELLTKATADLRAFNEGRGKAAEFLARIEAIKKAVGPKARSA